MSISYCEIMKFIEMPENIVTGKYPQFAAKPKSYMSKSQYARQKNI